MPQHENVSFMRAGFFFFFKSVLVPSLFLVFREPGTVPGTQEMLRYLLKAWTVGHLGWALPSLSLFWTEKQNVKMQRASDWQPNVFVP